MGARMPASRAELGGTAEREGSGELPHATMVTAITVGAAVPARQPPGLFLHVHLT